MSGKPAARQGDMTAIGGPIVQGSLGVMIGAPTGIACSVCPGGVVSGSPVNPLLGAKVLPGETDLALPGPVPFVLSRTYSSYQTKTPAPVGAFGPGWKAPSDIRLQIRDNALILNDNGGRSILFDPLFPGESAFSRNESFWLMRGGVLKLHDSNPLAALWHTLPETVRLSPHLYFATNSTLGPWWILGWAERAPSVDEILPAPLPPYRVLTGLADNFGRTLRYQREADGEFAGAITTVTDGVGRRFRLNYARFPDVPQTRYGADAGIRLTEVWLTHDPEYPQDLPAMPLVHYAYSPRGELLAVYDRSGSEVRAFTYDTQHPGRMVAHHYAGRPESRYEYDAAGRVTEQHNPGGLSYAYAYEQNRVIITDSLKRQEVLHTEGDGGLKRVVKKVFADGSTACSEFDPYGRLVAQTDAVARKTAFRLSPGSGLLDAIVSPDGRITTFSYSPQRQLIRTTYPDGLRSQREYDAQGRLTAETDRHGDTVRYTYPDPQSWLPSSREDATGSQQQMTWSRYGQLLTFTDCSGYQTRYEYDRFGQLTAMSGEEGLSLRRGYDARGQLVSQTDTGGHQTCYEYNAAGDLTVTVLPDGTRSETEYDTRGHAVSLTRGGLTRQMAYDAAGRVTQLTNENGRHTTFAYDPMDRLTEETGFDGRTQRYHYDPGGRLTRSDDENLITGWHYDESDRLSHRTVNGELAEQWLYDEHGWLESITHLSEGHPVAVHYGYDTRGRLNRERQTVTHPQTGELLWQHETLHGYHAGLISRVRPDGLPVVEWLTYGSGYLAGMKLGDTPLIEFTRDRLHRETQCGFGPHELTTTYTPGGHLQSRHLNGPLPDRDYEWNDAGALIRIRSPRQTKEYDYSDSGRLTQVRTVDDQQERFLAYTTDPAGNRLPDPQLYPHNTLTAWPDNRLSEDEHFLYHHDSHGRLTEKTDRLTTAGYRADDRRRWCYEYDNQHRLVHCTQTQHHEKQTESRYVYDPLGRRIGKRVWRHTRHSNGYNDSSPAETWYGWDGDRLTTTQTESTRIQTVYLPGSFTPLLRVETATEELLKATRRSLAEVLQQDTGITLPPVLTEKLDILEQEIHRQCVSEETRQWLAGCGLSVEKMARQMDPVYTPVRKIHLYHCDHRGLPQALINEDGSTAWQADHDAWSNVLTEKNPHKLSQLIRLPGQQYDEETGLYYNRHRYYDPQQGRYITQDPIGLRGGWNLYQYPLNPIMYIDPLGLIGEWGGLMSESMRRNGVSEEDIYSVFSAPFSGSISGDVGIALDAFGGGSLSIGAAIGGNENVPANLDICTYYSLCDHSGIGYGAGFAFSGTVSEAGISPGSYHTKGLTSSGGLLGKFSVTGVEDADGKYSGTFSMGPGAGTFSGGLTCSQSLKCLSQLFGY